MADTSLRKMLHTLRLPSVQRRYGELAETARAQAWSHEQYLQALVETECQDRISRRQERLLASSGLPQGKNLATLDLAAMPPRVGPLLGQLLGGDFVRRARNVLLFGLPGRGKTHLAAAIGREMVVRHDFRVLFTGTFALVQRLLAAKAALRLAGELARLDRYEVVILDDIGYVQQSRKEMGVLFTFLAERYERRTVMITSNLMFSEWDRIFRNPMTTACAIDRLVHHAEIVELNQTESYRAPKPSRRPPSSGCTPTPPSTASG
jgi:DNA replication protein DnaC